jgi:hypothetical protein
MSETDDEPQIPIRAGSKNYEPVKIAKKNDMFYGYHKK